jgi:hypothetical protein
LKASDAIMAIITGKTPGFILEWLKLSPVKMDQQAGLARPFQDIVILVFKYCLVCSNICWSRQDCQLLMMI